MKSFFARIVGLSSFVLFLSVTQANGTVIEKESIKDITDFAQMSHGQTLKNLRDKKIEAGEGGLLSVGQLGDLLDEAFSFAINEFNSDAKTTFKVRDYSGSLLETNKHEEKGQSYVYFNDFKDLVRLVDAIPVRNEEEEDGTQGRMKEIKDELYYIYSRALTEEEKGELTDEKVDAFVSDFVKKFEAGPSIADVLFVKVFEAVYDDSKKFWGSKEGRRFLRGGKWKTILADALGGALGGAVGSLVGPIGAGVGAGAVGAAASHVFGE